MTLKVKVYSDKKQECVECYQSLQVSVILANRQNIKVTRQIQFSLLKACLNVRNHRKIQQNKIQNKKEFFNITVTFKFNDEVTCILFHS